MSINRLSLDAKIAGLAQGNQTPLSQFNRNLNAIFEQPNLNNTPPMPSDVFISTPQPHQSCNAYASTQGNLWLFQGDGGSLHGGDVYLHTHTNNHPEGEVLLHEHGYFEEVTSPVEQKQPIQTFVKEYVLDLTGNTQKTFFRNLGTKSVYELGSTLQKEASISSNGYHKTLVDRIAQSFIRIRGKHFNFTDPQQNIEGTLVLSRQPLGGLDNYDPKNFAYRAPYLEGFMSPEQMNHREPYHNNQLPPLLYIYGTKLNGTDHLEGTLDVATGTIISQNTKSIPLVKRLLTRGCFQINTSS
jgi:hypothetical protein